MKELVHQVASKDGNVIVKEEDAFHFWFLSRDEFSGLAEPAVLIDLNQIDTFKPTGATSHDFYLWRSSIRAEISNLVNGKPVSLPAIISALRHFHRLGIRTGIKFREPFGGYAREVESKNPATPLTGKSPERIPEK